MSIKFFFSPPLSIHVLWSHQTLCCLSYSDFDMHYSNEMHVNRGRAQVWQLFLLPTERKELTKCDKLYLHMLCRDSPPFDNVATTSYVHHFFTTQIQNKQDRWLIFMYMNHKICNSKRHDIHHPFLQHENNGYFSFLNLVRGAYVP